VRASALIVTTVAFASLGPPLGSAVAVAVGMFLSLCQGRGVGNMIFGLVPLLILIQPIAFMLGEIPALVTGLVVALVAHRVPRLFAGPLWKRALLGGVTGAIAGAVWYLFSRRQLVATYHLPLIVASDLLTVAVIAGVPGAILGCFFPLRSWVAGAPSNNRWRGP
jgi:hypothetical protein